MSDVHELYAKSSELDPLPRTNNPQVCLLEQVVLVQLDGDKTAGETRTVDRRHSAVRKPEPREDVRQRARVVFVTVRNEDAAKLADTLGDVSYVRNDEVHTQHLFVGEHDAGVNEDQVIGKLESHHILADLAQPAQGNHSQVVGHSNLEEAHLL